jgi:hypothetical protein
MLWYRNWLRQTAITFNLFKAYISSVESPCTVDSTLSNLRLLPWREIGIVSTLPCFLYIVLRVASTPWVLYLGGYCTLFNSFQVPPRIPVYDIWSPRQRLQQLWLNFATKLYIMKINFLYKLLWTSQLPKRGPKINLRLGRLNLMKPNHKKWPQLDLNKEPYKNGYIKGQGLTTTPTKIYKGTIASCTYQAPWKGKNGNIFQVRFVLCML